MNDEVMLSRKACTKRYALLAIAILVSVSLAGQDRYALTFNHIALSVKEVDRSADFYKNVLDLREITNRSKIEGIRWFSLGEGKEVHLISTVKENVVINKAVHIALSTTKFDDFIATLNKRKITYSDWPGAINKINIRADGIRQVFFQDPDGYWIEVNEIK